MTLLTESQLADLGVQFGRDVRVSAAAQLFGAERITLGDHVRVDALCVLSTGTHGTIELGSFIHVSSGVRLFGGGTIRTGNFVTISAGSTLHSESDDFGGEWLVGPQVPDEHTNVTSTPLVLGDYAAVGAHSLLLPGAALGEGSVLGALSMTRSALDPWTIYAGVPAGARSPRARGLLARAREVLAVEDQAGDGQQADAATT